ncbi:hypothetical protein IXB28_08325 [Leptothoe kymatousa TAU-MAC 1615]|uniref:DUF4236 domain-containing protein n=1 Tax=Leptothoe kymatousa TAU-MAC 1615 TaxID=2364775 RepID=A0ABS5Y314_9CYAN|nr:hypothetical protein [Leptothoe kymatousa TAU-MAC 1615]
MKMPWRRRHCDAQPHTMESFNLNVAQDDLPLLGSRFKGQRFSTHPSRRPSVEITYRGTTHRR